MANVSYFEIKKSKFSWHIQHPYTVVACSVLITKSIESAMATHTMRNNINMLILQFLSTNRRLHIQGGPKNHGIFSRSITFFVARVELRLKEVLMSCWEQIGQDLTNKAIDQWLIRIHWLCELKEDTLNTVWAKWAFCSAWKTLLQTIT